jgi:hypothetical protein
MADEVKVRKKPGRKSMADAEGTAEMLHIRLNPIQHNKLALAVRQGYGTNKSELIRNMIDEGIRAIELRHGQLAEGTTPRRKPAPEHAKLVEIQGKLEVQRFFFQPNVSMLAFELGWAIQCMKDAQHCDQKYWMVNLCMAHDVLATAIEEFEDEFIAEALRPIMYEIEALLLEHQKPVGGENE